MAVVPTGEIFKTLTFDGQSSGDYGVYITGEAVYNAPARDVEMVTIPGRNGQLALDKGRFENIEVSYPAGIFADNETDFAQAVSDFRNFLASRSGYCRLEDDYNPNEYRMAVYKSGLEVDPKLLRAGKFDITFNCKPQRWLKDGETAVTVASGDVITNPTLFESSPLLEVDGSGEIQFNTYSINIETVVIGDVVINRTLSGNTITFNNIAQLLREGDEFSVTGLISRSIRLYDDIVSIKTLNVNEESTAPDGWTYYCERYSSNKRVGYRLVVSFPEIKLKYGTSYASETANFSVRVRGLLSVGQQTESWTDADTLRLSYDGADTLTISWHFNSGKNPYNFYNQNSIPAKGVIGYSTRPYDYGMIYCDCEIGELYRIEDGEIIAMNHVGDLGSDLPTLAPGDNEVTIDSTITQLDIVPRWWKI